ncbi:serine/threonine protein kinase [Nocardioides sp. JQ2195]|uniref:serine/threonine-protein kinase n=1 Tax=Nocardioides sp. JQ2195 TaxID=2592334 RepID=UPI00143E9369|nr:serine/threonine-protein kinase [Nocardioides sp. JQ2195]QIX27320.1 serine/threonine protein kinase [Nocardioides sp. JQ2195]
MGTLIAGRYEIGREIGRGGMGAVLLARDVVLDREVAVKRVGLTPGTDDTDIERVRREARVSAMLNHEHVVAVYDLVREGDAHWLVMEYVPSVNLGELIRRDGPLTPDDAARVVGQAATAVAAAHEAGIVHRDIKPSNLLVASDRTVKLSDFGIARTGDDPTLTQTGMVTGSPGYLSPEVASGHPASPASDVWSLGATVFHAVTGGPPYDTTENLIGALYRIVHEEPPRTDRAGWLEPLLLATMHRDPRARWSAQDVARFLNGGPGRAPAPVSVAVPASAPPAAATQHPAADPARHTPVEPVEPTAVFTPADDAKRSRGPAMIGALALVAAVVLGAWLMVRDDGDPGRASGADRDRTSQGTPKSSDTPPSDAPTAEGMSQFVTDYLGTVTKDPATTWTMLTPAFQDASGGYDSYSGFWGGVASAKVSDIVADPETLEVSYHVDYTVKGGEKSSDDVRLRLTYADGSYKINDEL